MKFLSRIGLLILVLILVPVTTCSFHKRTVYADPNVAPAYAQAKSDGQPLIEALDRFFAEHSYYPRSLSELPINPYALHGVRYEVDSPDRICRSLDCAARAKEFQGFVAAIPDYKAKLTAFREECVRGYSKFVVKSARIRTAWPVNQHLEVYAQFTSADARWSVEWCGPSGRTNHTGNWDCMYSAFDETKPPGPYVTAGMPRRLARPVITPPNPR